MEVREVFVRTDIGRSLYEEGYLGTTVGRNGDVGRCMENVFLQER